MLRTMVSMATIVMFMLTKVSAGTEVIGSTANRDGFVTYGLTFLVGMGVMLGIVLGWPMLMTVWTRVAIYSEYRRKAQEDPLFLKYLEIKTGRGEFDQVDFDQLKACVQLFETEDINERERFAAFVNYYENQDYDTTEDYQRYREFKDFLAHEADPQDDPEEKTELGDDARLLDFGKFKGESFGHVYAMQPGYVSWCCREAKRTGGFSSEGLRAFVSYAEARLAPRQ